MSIAKIIFRYTLCALLGLPVLTAVACNGNHPEKGCTTFEEMKDPTSDTLSDWSNVTAGLHASVISIDNKFPRSVAPAITSVSNVNVSGWRGEKVSAQLLLWAAEDIDEVEYAFNYFKSEGNSLPASVAQARFVRYVMTDEFGPGCGHRQPADFPASLAPDMLDNLECFNLEAKTVRPVWLTFDIPSDAAAGSYKGKLTIRARGQSPRDFKIELEVVDQLLPEPSEWSYHLDL